MAIEKIKILWAVLEPPAKQHCQSSPFTSKIGPNGLNWQCCLAGSSKTAPRILIFSIAMGAKPSFQLKSIAIWAPAFFMHNNSFIEYRVFIIKSDFFDIFFQFLQFFKVCAFLGQYLRKNSTVLFVEYFLTPLGPLGVRPYRFEQKQCPNWLCVQGRIH